MTVPSYARNTGAPGTPIVFVPGIKGSALVGPDGALRWIGAAAALGFSHPRLELPLRVDGDRQADDGLRATQPLASIRVVPGLFESAVYAPWLARAEALGRPFYGFAYDWRRDNLETLDSLRACIAAVRARHACERVDVVAHSLGGLVTLALLNEKPEWFAHAVFAGAPFRGGVGFLPDMHVGSPTGLNRRITSPRMLFSCPSVYSFYPQNRSDCIDARGRPLALDFYAAGTWVEQGLGVFARAEEATRERVEFLGWALGRARRFRSLLEASGGPYPRVSNVVGASRPTLDVAVRDGPRSVRGWDLVSAPRALGDGRVCRRNALLPDGVPGTLVEIDAGHSALLDGPTVAALLQ